MSRYGFRLYVTGQSYTSKVAMENLQQICRGVLRRNYAVEIIDVLSDSKQAEADRVLATPTLIRLHPLPPRRVIGDLSDLQKVLWALELPTEQGIGASSEE